MRVQGDWITASGAQTILRALDVAGFQALFVGGSVRNALLGMPISDIDIATNATPDQVIAIAKNTGLRTVPTGISHGTVTVLTETGSYEVTTFRRDIETDGRHAKVMFSQNIAQDAARRDFTMNAIYATPLGDLVDPLGGLPDLLARRLRCVGDPAIRIAEDYLRILRYFRFHAIYADPDHGFDPDALAAISSNLHGLETLSAERIGHEMRKLLGAHDPAPAVNTMAQLGVLRIVLPGSDPKLIAPLVHLENGAPRSWLARLAIVAGGQVALRLSKSEQETLGLLRTEMAGTKTPAALGWCHGAMLAGDMVHLRAALFSSPLPPNWQDEIGRGVAARFPVSAADFMPELCGPALGQRLRSLENRWLQSDLRLTRPELLS